MLVKDRSKFFSILYSSGYYNIEKLRLQNFGCIQTSKQHAHAGVLNQSKYAHAVFRNQKKNALDKFVNWCKGQEIKGDLSSVTIINIVGRAFGQNLKKSWSVDTVLAMPSPFLGTDTQKIPTQLGQ